MLTIATMLERRAERHGDTVALIDDETGQEWTVGELERASATAAHRLLGAGVVHGDRVAILSANHPEMVVAYLAIARIGAIVVPLNWRLTAPELEQIARDAGVRALIVERSCSERAEALAAAVDVDPGRRWSIGDSMPDSGSLPDFVGARPHDATLDRVLLSDHSPAGADLLYLMYTSGTTGRPKGAVHTHASTMAATVGAVEAMDYRPGDRYLNVMPLFHVASLAMVNICLYRRCTMVLGRAFDPVRAWTTIAERRVDAMMAVPVMLAAMASAFDPELDTSCLRVLSSGAAPVPLPLLERYHRMGIDIVQAYGLTESGGAVSVLDASDAVSHLGSAGKPLLSLDLRIVDPEGNVAPRGQAGEILVRGPSVTTTYWGVPESTVVDGWLHTGDVGIVDPDGFLTICDRLKDMVISGGENVYSAEVESVLLGHPGVRDVAVIGQPSERWGESPCAVVVAEAGLDQDEMIAWARERLAAFKVPRSIELIDELPRNAGGKVLKGPLRDRFPGPAPE